jgi:heme-degrading monooxygenase HmoA
MIARIWSAEATQSNAPAYAAHLKARVLPDLSKVEGYLGAMLLERPVADAMEIIVITYWRSAESVRGFAGDDSGRAVVADEAASLLTRFDRHVSHYEVLMTDRI